MVGPRMPQNWTVSQKPEEIQRQGCFYKQETQDWILISVNLKISFFSSFCLFSLFRVRVEQRSLWPLPRLSLVVSKMKSARNSKESRRREKLHSRHSQARNSNSNIHWKSPTETTAIHLGISVYPLFTKRLALQGGLAFWIFPLHFQRIAQP